MRRLTLAMCFLMTLAAAFAEYQVFDFKASYRTLRLSLVSQKGVQTKAWDYGSDTLKGYLVTVCCYPCNASMGKNYPTWLFVVRSKDKDKVLWKIPCKVEGGMNGKRVDIAYLSDPWAFNKLDVGPAEVKYIKKIDKAWMNVEFDSQEAVPVVLKRKEVLGDREHAEYWEME